MHFDASLFIYTKYTYDTQNRPITSTDALGMVVTNTYDVNGNLVKTVDKNNNILNYVYDPMGNLIEKSSQSDENSQKENIQTYTYNRMNLPLTVTAGGITSTYTYDNLGQLLKEELTTGEVKEYNYDKVGNVTSFKLTKDGVQKFNTVYSYDKLDRVQSITNGTNVSSYTYDRNGRLSESTTNGTTTTYGYNRAGWVTSLATQSGSSQLQSHNYQYYPDGNISAKQSTVGTLSEQVSYQYDDAGRLIREQIGNDITAFTYDNYSNRATMTNGSTANTYTYDANNRLLKAVKTENNVDEITNYIYDNNGNQIAWYKGSISPSGGTASLALTDETDGTDYGYYTYDAFNRLSTYTNGVTNASYTYGADNLRKSKTVDGVTTNYVWNGSNMVLEENSTGINKYYYGADGIAFADFNGTTNYYQKNAHGDITALTNANGTITRNYQFDAFGNELTNNTNDINPFRYAGQYQDDETGLIYLRNRYYDSNNGRFITEDPIKDGLNWYVYANNNPIMFIDPFGLYADGDETLPFIINYIINGTDGKTGGLTAQWNSAKTQEEKNRIAKVANMLRCETTDYDITKTSSVMLLLDKNGANVLGESMGHMAIMIVNSENQGIYFSYAGEDGTPLDDGVLSMDILSKTEMDQFIKTGNLPYVYKTNGTISTDNYTDYITLEIDSISGSGMIGKGVYNFWNPGTYFVGGHQCDNVASSIMSAGGKGYTVQWRPKASFEYASNYFGAEKREF